MALKIRLARGGSKKRPYYQIVVADARSPRDGRFLEKLGSWNPMLAKDDEKRIELNAERVQHWIAQGAQPTDRVMRFLDQAGLAKRPARNNRPRRSPARRHRNVPLKPSRRPKKQPLQLRKQPRNNFRRPALKTGGISMPPVLLYVHRKIACSHPDVVQETCSTFTLDARR